MWSVDYIEVVKGEEQEESKNKERNEKSSVKSLTLSDALAQSRKSDIDEEDSSDTEGEDLDSAADEDEEKKKLGDSSESGSDQTSIQVTNEDFVVVVSNSSKNLEDNTDGYTWVRRLVFRAKLTMHTAFERSDNADPAAVTALAVSKDHRTVYVGDERGRVFSWVVSSKPGKGNVVILYMCRKFNLLFSRDG